MMYHDIYAEVFNSIFEAVSKFHGLKSLSMFYPCNSAEDLLLVPNGPHRGQSKLGGTASEALPQKLFRTMAGR